MKRCSKGPEARTTKSAVAACALLTVLARPALGAGFDYALRPQPIADGVYAVIGRTEDFTRENGGNVVNTGFIVGPQGVVVIDTGPSKRYGEQLRRTIARITPLPIALVVNTHHHPDHIFGNQAFPADTLAAMPEVSQAIREEGPGLLDNLYRLIGPWMTDTRLVVPERPLAAGRLRAGGRDLELIALGGHTGSDLAILDVISGTLFAGDIVFNGRAPTTPHADVPRWLDSLGRLGGHPFKYLVPGHGQVARDAAPAVETGDYLRWLDHRIRTGAEQGLELDEMRSPPVPSRFRNLALVEREFPRSLAQLYPRAEAEALRPLP